MLKIFWILSLAFPAEGRYSCTPTSLSTISPLLRSPGLLKAWEDDAYWTKRQPGYISTQLRRAIGRRSRFHRVQGKLEIVGNTHTINGFGGDAGATLPATTSRIWYFQWGFQHVHGEQR